MEINIKRVWDDTKIMINATRTELQHKVTSNMILSDEEFSQLFKAMNEYQSKQEYEYQLYGE